MRNLKMLFVFLVIMIAGCISSLSEWFYQKPFPYNNNFFDVHFVDALTGWVVGNRGILLKTTSGGESWIVQNKRLKNNLKDFTNLNINLYSLTFINENTGWVVGSKGVIIKTSDGGGNWIFQNIGMDIPWFSVTFANANTGWVVGGEGNIIKTTDGGETWVIQNSGSNSILKSVWFINDKTGWVVGRKYGTILKTTDGGENWKNISIEEKQRIFKKDSTLYTGYNFESVTFTDEITGWVVGSSGMERADGRNGKIFKTTNGGLNWISQNSGTDALLSDVTFANAYTGWVVGLRGTILKTTNGGENWISQRMSGEWIHGVNFVDENLGWVVGDYGMILKTVTGGEE